MPADELQAVIFLHGIWRRHIKEFGIEGQIPSIPSPVKAREKAFKNLGIQTNMSIKISLRAFR